MGVSRRSDTQISKSTCSSYLFPIDHCCGILVTLHSVHSSKWKDLASSLCRPHSAQRTDISTTKQLSKENTKLLRFPTSEVSSAKRCFALVHGGNVSNGDSAFSWAIALWIDKSCLGAFFRVCKENNTFLIANLGVAHYLSSRAYRVYVCIYPTLQLYVVSTLPIKIKSLKKAEGLGVAQWLSPRAYCVCGKSLSKVGNLDYPTKVPDMASGPFSPDTRQQIKKKEAYRPL